MHNWEYQLRPLSDDDVKTMNEGLNNMGRAGWELVQIVSDEKVVAGPTAIFKRAKY